MSSMWAPDNAQELQSARQTPRKTPFAAQHAKARDQGFWAPESDASGSAPSPGRRAKSGPGRSRGQGPDAMTPDRGRASGRGRSRGGPHFQPPPEQMTSPIQQTTSARGYGRKTTKDREAIWQSIWGDDSDEDKEKDKANDAKGKEKEVEVKPESTDVKVDNSEKLAKDLESVKITPAAAPPPAPPAVVIPPPPVISGADWSELTDDEDLAFLEDVPVPLAWQSESPENASPAEKPKEATVLPAEKQSEAPAAPAVNGSANVSHRLDVTTANDVADSVHEGSPRVNVRHTQQETPKEASETVDVKLANPLPVSVNPEQAQTSAEIGSENDSSFTTVGRGGRSEANTGLQGSRWAGAPPVRGTGNQRGGRGGRMPPNNQQMPFRNQPPQNFPRPPAQFNRPPPSGPRANQVPLNQLRGTGSRNAPPLQGSSEASRPTTANSTASESDRSSPHPQSTPSETSVEDGPADMQQRGPRQAGVPRDAVKRLMKGFMGPGSGGPRRGTSGRGRGRAPAGGQAPTQEAS